MGRKAKSTPQEKLAYHGRLANLVLPNAFVEEVSNELPDKSVTRIQNARKGIVYDIDVLEVLERISNRERGRRAGLALQPVTA